MASFDEALTPLLLTLKVAGWATLIAFVFALAWAYLLTRFRLRGAELLDAAFTLPMVLPPTVLGYYLLVLIGRRSTFGAWLEDAMGIRLIFTWQGAALAASVVAFPLIYKAARAALQDVEPQLEQAARLLGAGEAKVFFRVSLPLAWRGVLSGSMLGFARAMGEFGATLMIAGSIPGKTQTMSIAIYEAVQAGRDDVANFLVVVTSVVCLFVLVGSGWLLRRRHW